MLLVSWSACARLLFGVVLLLQWCGDGANGALYLGGGGTSETWWRANELCASVGQRLAVIDSQAKQNELNALIARYGEQDVT